MSTTLIYLLVGGAALYWLFMMGGKDQLAGMLGGLGAGGGGGGGVAPVAAAPSPASDLPATANISEEGVEGGLGNAKGKITAKGVEADMGGIGAKIGAGGIDMKGIEGSINSMIEKILGQRGLGGLKTSGSGSGSTSLVSGGDLPSTAGQNILPTGPNDIGTSVNAQKIINSVKMPTSAQKIIDDVYAKLNAMGVGMNMNINRSSGKSSRQVNVQRTRNQNNFNYQTNFARKRSVSI